MIKLINGDCLEEMKKIPDGSIDLVLTDPPYGTTACKWDSVIPLDEMWEQLSRLVKPKRAVVVTASQPFTTTLISSNLKNYKYNWIWNKRAFSNQMMAKKQPLRITEDVVVFNSGIYFPQGLVEVNKTTKQGARITDNIGGGIRPKSYVQTHTNYPKNLIEFQKDRPSLHPTQKPVALMEYLVKTYTQPGDTVLDFTMGSGTTGVACVNTGRSFIGIELDKTYFDIAQKRIEEAQATATE